MKETNRSVLLDARVLRILIFVVVAIATLVTLWALIEGGDRDLWSALMPWGYAALEPFQL